MATPSVPDPFWKALSHRRDEAWQTSNELEAMLPDLDQRDRARRARSGVRSQELQERFPAAVDHTLTGGA